MSLFDAYNQTYDYVFYLCQPNGEPIAQIVPYDVEYDCKIAEIQTLSFRVDEYAELPERRRTPYYDKLRKPYLIYMETRIDGQVVQPAREYCRYFVIEQPEEERTKDNSTKRITAYSMERTLTSYHIREYDEVRKLYGENETYEWDYPDYDETAEYKTGDKIRYLSGYYIAVKDGKGNLPTDRVFWDVYIPKGGVLNMLLDQTYGIWSVANISPNAEKLLEQPRAISINNDDGYGVLGEIQKAYECVFLCYCWRENGSMQCQIDITTKDELGENLNICLSGENWLEQLSIEQKDEEMATILYGYGEDNLGIHAANPTGEPYVFDFSYYYDDMSAQLRARMESYVALVQSKEGVEQPDGSYPNGTFRYYLAKLEQANRELLELQRELYDETTLLYQYEDNEDLCIALDSYNMTEKEVEHGKVDGHDHKYWHNQAKQQQKVVDGLETSISAKETEIDGYYTGIDEIRETLSFSSNFTPEQLRELSLFMQEQEYSNPYCYDEDELYELTKLELARRSKPPAQFTVGAVDLFSTPAGAPHWAQMKLGSILNLEADFDNPANLIPLHLVGYTHKIDAHQLTIDLSTDYFYKDPVMNLNKAINAGQDANDDLAVNGPTYGDYQNDKDKVEDILNNGISSDKTEIAIGNNGVMERRGYYMRQIQGGSGALKILEDKILFSEDGTFADYKTAISSKGVWAETVFGILLAGETLEIKNTGNNFKVDENGLTMENQAGNFAITADGVRINELDLMLTRGNSRITLQNYFDMTSENNPSEPQTTPMLIEKKVGGIWTPVFQIDQNGNVIMNDLTANNAILQGKFTAGGENSEKTVIDGNGIQSYNAAGKKGGLWTNDKTAGSEQRFADLTLWMDGQQVFQIYNLLGSVSLRSYDSSFLTSAGNTTTANGIWRYKNSNISTASEIATQKNVDDLQAAIERQLQNIWDAINELRANQTT